MPELNISLSQMRQALRDGDLESFRQFVGQLRDPFDVIDSYGRPLSVEFILAGNVEALRVLFESAGRRPLKKLLFRLFQTAVESDSRECLDVLLAQPATAEYTGAVIKTLETLASSNYAKLIRQILLAALEKSEQPNALLRAARCSPRLLYGSQLERALHQLVMLSTAGTEASLLVELLKLPMWDKLLASGTVESPDAARQLVAKLGQTDLQANRAVAKRI